MQRIHIDKTVYLLLRFSCFKYLSKVLIIGNANYINEVLNLGSG
jgi:hypothetical protein